MKPVSRLVDDAPEELARSAALLRELPTTASSHPARLEAQWRELEKKARAPKQGVFTHVLAGLGSAAVASLLVWLWLGPSSSPEPLATSPWVALNGARLSADSVPLLEGQVRGQPSVKRVTLRTSHAEVSWSQARFLLDSTQARTLLVVDEGEVELRADGRLLRVRAGESLELPPPTLQVPAELLALQPVAPSNCNTAANREQCLRAAAAGTDLAAQNALFELALWLRDEQHSPSAALEAWKQYDQRFPDGVFRIEARASAVLTLAQLGRRNEARAAAETFSRDFPDDPLVSPVRALSAQFGPRLQKK